MGLTHSITDSPLAQSEQSLHMLAALAAIEFDVAIRGKPTNFDAARRLGERLMNTLGGDNASDLSLSGFDYSTVAMVGRALEPYHKPSTTLAEIVRSARNIAAQLESPTASSDSDRFRICRHFCVTLSQNLLAYREAKASARLGTQFSR